MGIRRGEAKIQFTPKVEKSLTRLSNPNFPGVLSTPCHLLAHLYLDAENMGKRVSEEVAFKINSLCVLLPDVSLTGWVTLGM